MALIRPVRPHFETAQEMWLSRPNQQLQIEAVYDRTRQPITEIKESMWNQLSVNKKVVSF